jgi:LCP family protein required for cell wall assembly
VSEAPGGPGADGPVHRGARYYRLPRRRRTWVALLAWTLWMLVGLATAVVGGAYIFVDDTLSAAAPDTPEAEAARQSLNPVARGEPVNMLLIGSDRRDSEDGHTDTLILVRMDGRANFISMLSFARDLWVEIPGHGEGRINGAFGAGGTKAVIDTVENLTNLPVNHYAVVDFEAFRSIVDEVGGVYLDVDRRYFNDNAGCVPGLTCYEQIDLRPGYQRLNGTDALDYVRYRHTDDDFARIARQQQFLSDLKRQTRRLGNLSSLTAFRDIFEENIELSIKNPRQFLNLLDLALTLPDDRIARARIEGMPTDLNGAAVNLPDDTEIANAVEAWQNPTFPEEERPARIDPASVAVAVLNGNGRASGAEQMADLLRTKGYDARNGGNAEAFDYADSAVRYGPETYDAARQVQRLLGPGTGLEPLEPGTAPGADVVVVAGSTFDGTFPKPPPPPKPAPAETLDTESVVDPVRRAGRALGLRVMAPLKVAEGSRLLRMETYRIDGRGGKAPAVKLVFDVPGRAGRPAYWGVMMTSMDDPPILEGRTGTFTSGGREYLTFYDGKNLQRLAFQVDGVTYWVSNSLDYALNANTIQEIAKSMRPTARAKLPKKRTPTPIEVALDAPTP